MTSHDSRTAEKINLQRLVRAIEQSPVLWAEYQYALRAYEDKHGRIAAIEAIVEVQGEGFGVGDAHENTVG